MTLMPLILTNSLVTCVVTEGLIQGSHLYLKNHLIHQRLCGKLVVGILYFMKHSCM